MSISASSRDKVFVGLESAYGTAAALTATSYVRTTAGSIDHNPYQLEPDPTRRAGDDEADPLRRRSMTTASMTALLPGAPGGSNAPDLDALLHGAFGAAPVGVDAVGDTTAQAVEGRALGVVDGGAGTGLLLPVIAAAGGATATVPVTGTIAYASRNYHLSGDVPSVTLRTQPTDAGSTAGTGPGTPGAPPQLATGWTIGECAITLDGTGEASVSFSGPARDALQGSAAGADIDFAPLVQAAPYPQGMTGRLWVSDLSQPSPTWVEVPFGWRSASVTIQNNLVARNDESGSYHARSVYRTNRRGVPVEITTYAEQNHVLWAILNASQTSVPPVSVVFSLGTVEGSRAMIYLPRVLFNRPPPDGDPDAQGFTFSGRASGTGQDAVTLALG